jgi:hypothetical protein
MALERGDYETARQALLPAVSQDASPFAGPPALRAVLLDINTANGLRRFDLTLEEGPVPGSSDALLSDLESRFALVGEARIERQPGRLILTIPAGDAQQTATIQETLAGHLPEAPELAMLADALRPNTMLWGTTSTKVRASQWYTETVEFSGSHSRWNLLAERLEYGAETAEKEAGEADGERAVAARLRAALHRHDAAAWRALANSSRIRYRVTLEGENLDREWVVQPGQERVLTASATQWRSDRLQREAQKLGGALVGLALLLTLSTLSLRRILRPRARGRAARVARPPEG